jgi:hypothetical protein
MDRTLVDLLHALPDRATPARHSRELMEFAQSDGLFRLAARKSTRTRALREHFAGRPVQRLCLSSRLHELAFDAPGLDLLKLDRDWFQDPSAASRAAKRDLLDGAVVVVNNNDVAHGRGESHFAEFVSHCTRTIFVGWDWDNHHWLDLSTELAALSDLYCPAHHENLYLLSRYNWSTAGPLYCGTIQWSRSFLAEQLPHLLGAERSPQPLGMHVPYGAFVFRNRVVATVGATFPSVGFSDPTTFHARTPRDRLLEWAAHKTHWITPVLNDVPIRLFDALITGGVPIVPDSLRHLPPVAGLPRDAVVFYAPDDVIAPAAVVERAVSLFDRGGAEGIVRRHRLAMEHHHADARLRTLADRLADQFALRLGTPCRS